jgi:predicted PurR-regulated permease PerM
LRYNGFVVEDNQQQMPTYSRLSRFQQRRVLTQSLVLLFFSIAFIVLFVFIILPLTARLVELIPSKSTNSNTTKEQEIA